MNRELLREKCWNSLNNKSISHQSKLS